MSAAGASGRPCRRPAFGLVVSAALLVSITQAGHAEQAAAPSPLTSALEDWDGKSAVTLDQLKLHTTKIGELLDHASARVDRLAGETADQSKGRTLVGAIRQELNLSRQWNRHLASILLKVAEARRALGVREQKAAAEISELTTIAEEAHLELLALKKSLIPTTNAPSGKPSEIPAQKPGKDQHSTIETDNDGMDVSKALAGPSTTIEDIQRVLDDMSNEQMTAAGDIEVVRAKIIDALHTLAPHRKAPFRVDIPESRQIEGSLSSQEITAWAASIASKLHHEGFENIEQARARSVFASTPNVEAMVMKGEALSTTAVRIAPDRRALPIATVVAGSRILVTGKVIDLNWYRVEIDGGRHGFVSGDFIKPLPAPTKPTRRIKAS